DARVAVSGKKHDSGIIRARLDVLVRRVLVKIGKLLLLFGRAVLRGPVRTLFEILIAKHIEQRISAPDGRKQLGMLRNRCPHKQPAVGSARDGKVFRRGVLLLDEIAGCGKPVVKDVLLLFKHPLLVPAFTVFTAAAHVRNGKPATLLQPPRPCRIPRWRLAQVESAIPSHQQTLGAILLQALLACNKYRNPSTVLRFA